MANNSRIITAPDLDLEERFKVLLVDVEWSDIELLSQSIKKLDDDVTLFLYGSNDNDDRWCLNMYKHAHVTLINGRFSGNKELLKGWLLAQDNVSCYGQTEIGDYSHRTVFDIYSWFATNYTLYQSTRKEKHDTKNRT